MSRKKRKVLGISFLAVAFAVTAGFAVQARAQAAQYRRMAENSSQRAFAELTAAVGELDAALEKGLYATTPSLFAALCTQAYGKALAAQTALGELPYGNVELEQTAAFLAKTGDYVMVLSKNAFGETVCTEEERETLRGLWQAASALSEALRDLEAGFYAGTVEPQDLEEIQARLAQAAEEGQVPAGSVFQTIESEFPEVPTLIYDGPFSEHLAGRTPRMLEGLPQVSVQEAQAAAAAFLDLKAEVFTLASEGAGEIPTYGFTARVDGGSLWVEVTQTGGQILSVMNDRAVSGAVLSQEEARQAAAAFLEERGYAGMVPTYFIQQEGVLTANFAAVQDGVVCYPDLVKVSVALDSGRLVGFESHGYLMNHGSRTLDQPAVDREEARAAVSPALSVMSHQLAVIPTNGQNEVLCYEFKCRRPDGGHAIVYLNAQTGQEERILLLLEDETGTLVL